ncbi:MAG: LytTR family DNA-binding domain-containing protein [Ginsengibacter sp.]
MLNVIIIEDEKPAMELLSQALCSLPAAISIKAKLNSVKESINYFSGKPEADLIFSDVQLSDGLAFDIFAQTGVEVPVIFITGYDNYVMRAFETNGIDYLLKPLDKDNLEKSILRYNSLKSHFSNTRLSMPLRNLEDFLCRRKKTRLIVKSGLENISLLLENVALLYTVDKVVYVIDRYSKKYLSEKTLTELEEELDYNSFFRANRQYIINIGFVKSFKPHEKVKLAVDIAISDASYAVIISQECAPKFRKWIQNA